MTQPRDHGGGLDAAIAEFGGTRDGWLDLSTGINPVPYPVGDLPNDAWTALPDSGAMDRLLNAARAFWNVPDTAQIFAANGASALISQMPRIARGMSVDVPKPTYNEHAAAFDAAGYDFDETSPDVRVLVHPNNPDGRLWDLSKPAPLTIVDESFCDVKPDVSHIAATAKPGTIVLKSFGKFWGLAGARLGFAIAHPDTLSGLSDLIGPWSVNGPTLAIAERALSDHDWAEETRTRLSADAMRLDALMAQHGLIAQGGTSLFRLYDTESATNAQRHLAQSHIWSRVFPYSDRWLRLGLPAPDRWGQLHDAL